MPATQWILLLFSCSVASNSLQPQGLQHARLPCPSKYWSFSFSPSNEYLGLISFRIVWFDLLAVQGTLKSLLQHPSLKVSILGLSAFFMVQLTHPYMTTGKTLALTIWTFVDKSFFSVNTLLKLYYCWGLWAFPACSLNLSGRVDLENKLPSSTFLFITGLCSLTRWPLSTPDLSCFLHSCGGVMEEGESDDLSWSRSIYYTSLSPCKVFLRLLFSPWCLRALPAWQWMTGRSPKLEV